MSRVTLAKSPEGYKAMLALGKAVDSTGLDPKIIDLVKIRVSQINGCAFCLDMHTREAREHGETERRIYNIPSWHEAPFFTDKERAALLLAEAVTNVSQTHVPDAIYDEAAKSLDESELIGTILAAVLMNSWNRISISTGAKPPM
ncbi:MAG: carboxymuconolactone decarboxylase family protein [Tepidiformaceae bacterium]